MNKRINKKQILKIANLSTTVKRTIDDQAMKKMELAYAAIYGDDETIGNTRDGSIKHKCNK